MSTITERVEKGAALLDEKRPGWWRDIDLLTLDIASRCGCVIGQLAGITKASDRGLVYEAATRSLGVGYTAEISMGFEAPMTREFGGDRGTAIAAEYAALTAAWRDLITGRRTAASVTA
jgi:hypothetical protein